MGKLTVTEMVTLDGVAQAPGAPDEDRDGGFDLGGWQAPLHDPKGSAVMLEQAQEMDALLLGRKTYDIFANYWPDAPQDNGFSKLLNGVPKYVASRTLAEPLTWKGSSVIADVAAGVAALKERHDEVHVIGSLDLVHSLLPLGLVDRLELWVFPVVLGSGKRVFDDATVPTALRLADAITFPTGTLELVYETAGTPVYGNVA